MKTMIRKLGGRMPAALLTIAILALTPFPVQAAEGRIPVFLPGTFIGANGKYIVTRNITGPLAGPLITIGAPDVDLDLNGFVLDNTGGGPVVEFGVGTDHGTIRNGSLAGGTFSINVPGPMRKLTIEGIRSHDSTGPSAFNLAGGIVNAVIRNNEIVAAAGGGINWGFPGIVAQGTIEENLVRGAGGNGITICNCSSVAILNNRIEDVAPAPPIPPFGFGMGIQLIACQGALVSDNTIQTVGAQGIAIRNGQGNKLFNNVVRAAGSHGILLDYATTDTLVVKNNSSGNGFPNPPGDGLYTEGDLAMILDNLFNSNQRYGLHFSAAILPPGPSCVPPPTVLLPAACSNTFTRNTARGNFGGPPATPCAGPPVFPLPNFCNDVAGCPAAGANNTGTLNMGAAAAPF